MNALLLTFLIAGAGAILIGANQLIISFGNRWEEPKPAKIHDIVSEFCKTHWNRGVIHGWSKGYSEIDERHWDLKFNWQLIRCKHIRATMYTIKDEEGDMVAQWLWNHALDSVNDPYKDEDFDIPTLDIPTLKTILQLKEKL
jgi:hypothetical protein